MLEVKIQHNFVFDQDLSQKIIKVIKLFKMKMVHLHNTQDSYETPEELVNDIVNHSHSELALREQRIRIQRTEELLTQHYQNGNAGGNSLETGLKSLIFYPRDESKHYQGRK